MCYVPIALGTWTVHRINIYFYFLFFFFFVKTEILWELNYLISLITSLPMFGRLVKCKAAILIIFYFFLIQSFNKHVIC
jgi:hypothetical protein